MRTVRSTLLLVGAMIFSVAAVGSADAALSVKGRTFGVYVNAPSINMIDAYYCDTGWLPPQGGSLTESATNLDIPGVLQSASIYGTADGDECSGDSHITLGATTLLAGTAAEVSFDGGSGDDDDECCDTEPDVPVPFVFDNLRFGGVPVTVTGAFDQQIAMSGVGMLTINKFEGHDDDDCDDDDFRIIGLHLQLDNGDLYTVGSVYFESDDDCCPTKSEQKTWGQVKTLFTGSR